jgi:hypothetical protein
MMRKQIPAFIITLARWNVGNCIPDIFSGIHGWLMSIKTWHVTIHVKQKISSKAGK